MSLIGGSFLFGQSAVFVLIMNRRRCGRNRNDRSRKNAFRTYRELKVKLEELISEDKELKCKIKELNVAKKRTKC